MNATSRIDKVGATGRRLNCSWQVAGVSLLLLPRLARGRPNRLEGGGETFVNLVEVEPGGVEIVAEPFDRLLVHLVFGVAQRLDPFVVAADAAHVVKRGGVFTRNAPRDVIG